MTMLPKSISQSVLALFSVCVAGAAMNVLVGDGESARSLRALCALAASVCALYALKALVNL